jgi:flagellar protein FlbD
VIAVTRLNDQAFIVNADLIETIEANPDSVITLTTGRKYVVRESVDEIVRRVMDYHERVVPTIIPPKPPDGG